MTLDFRYKDYKCEYLVGNRYVKSVCFWGGCGDGQYGKNKKHAHITYIWSKTPDELNYCFLDKETMLRYFMDISKRLGFKLLSFIETPTHYKLQIDVIANRRYFIYVSMYIRYVYEFPFSLALYCALQNTENFPELDITHIIQFYIAVLHDGARCHCPGRDRLAFYNINCKCQFSSIRDNFNDGKSLVAIKSQYTHLLKNFRLLNSKNLPQIVSGINNIVNQHYNENKKIICRW